MKRAIDLIVSLPGLLFVAVVAPLIAILIKLDSPGPAIFVQTRVGKGERHFRCYKFRTMRLNTAERPTHQASQSEITRVGRFLRASKLDELPQLYNVMRGEMSLVGPRPCLPSQTELIAARRARGVTNVPPGVTGLAQALGIDMSDPERLSRIDERYVETQSLELDLRIIWATFFGWGLGDVPANLI
jgi:O-antigen biosynthesis protein WbqP